jgi:general secretion pathway protein G
MKTFRTGFLSLLLISATVNAQPQVSPQTDAAVVQTKEAALKTALFQMRDAIDRYYADQKRYPRGLDSLMTEKYLRRIPTDPSTGSTHSWRTIKAQPDRTHPGIAAGIYDVKSASTATALDGTKYWDW